MFQLSFPISPSLEKITLNDEIISIGSCFAENIGQKLNDFKFSCHSNPFGTIYNPISISQLLMDEIDENASIESHGIHYHWQAHGAVSALSEKELISLLSHRRKEFQATLLTAKWLIITLGSAFAYRLKSNGQVVANCHKIPQSEFTKELLSVDEMCEAPNKALIVLRQNNPQLKVILTVSPVRHIKDGLIENNRSKARLIEVAHKLKEESSLNTYFPAYEIMQDELRDYRFYAKDRVHPSDEAVDYIWNRFSETYFDQATQQFLAEWQSIRSALHHRPFHPSSQQHQQFVKVTIAKLNSLSAQVDVSAEVSLLQKQLL